jgi:predicted DNA-binding transcriptional regulator YafY
VAEGSKPEEGTMKLDRLLGILTTLMQRDSISAPELAVKFEVSRRTICRDIDALCMAGIPVVTRQGGGGGVSIAPGYKLDRSVLTSDELDSMLAALKGLGTVTEKSKIERTLDKLTPGDDRVVSLKESIVIDLASHYKGSLTGKIETIKQAVREDRLIEFDYYYDKGECRRRIEPSFLTFQWTAWYVFGYCATRQDWRLFKLARLWNLRLCDERFVPREIPEEKRDFGARLTDDRRLIALFDPAAKYQLIETYGPDSFTEAADGRLRLEVGYTHPEFIKSWLLGFGEKAIVLEPEELAKDLRGTIKKMFENYR